MQGVVKSYDPIARDGVVLRESDLAEIELAEDALLGSVFRMLRPGQRVKFDLNELDQAINVRLGSEVDMGTPAWLAED
jgi:CspA family cold shock protein